MARQNFLEAMLTGAAAGFAATIPMTATMLTIQRVLPWRERTRLEPRRVSDDMLRRVGVKDELTEEGRKQAAIAAHFGYGAACGAGYGAIEPLIPAPRGLRGPLYGLAVWAGSYVGWLPALGTLPPPHRRPAGRTALLVASHLVWGAALEAAQQSAAMVNGAPSGDGRG